jgi:hypothetical protein
MLSVSFTGPGNYWLASPDGQTKIDLGSCNSELELRKAIDHSALALGLDEFEWPGWYTRRDEP